MVKVGQPEHAKRKASLCRLALLPRKGLIAGNLVRGSVSQTHELILAKPNL